MIKIINADVIDGLKSLPDNHVQCVVTSPPYWALRDYGNEGQIGLEKTPQEFLDKMVAVFQEVKRVLRKDGTCWVNMGDGYVGPNNTDIGGNANFGSKGGVSRASKMGGKATWKGLPPKNLIGMPWRLALALQADGWWLRSDIIWHKPNPMPESCTDRPTKSHEYIFMLTKSARYYYDAEAIKEPAQDHGMRDRSNWQARTKAESYGQKPHTGGENGNYAESGRNKRTVWTIPTAPYPGAHYATFPPALPEICIKAGSKTGDIVLDPFNGHGTTGLVAARMGRKYIGIEINEGDCTATQKRIVNDNPLFNKVEIVVKSAIS